jgi:hypothetical protein
MIPKQSQPALNDLADRYAKELYSKAHSLLSQDKYVNKGELLDSLKINVIKCTDNIPPQIMLTFALQGALLNLRTMSWVKFPNVKKLLDWADNINFTGSIPGYKNNASNLPPWKAKQRIVYAIAVNQRKNDKWKSKPWKGKKGIDLGAILDHLNTETAAQYANDFAKILASSIETGAVLS